jgi:hypothetical protein
MHLRSNLLVAIYNHQWFSSQCTLVVQVRLCSGEGYSIVSHHWTGVYVGPEDFACSSRATGLVSNSSQLKNR